MAFDEGSFSWIHTAPLDRTPCLHSDEVCEYFQRNKGTFTLQTLLKYLKLHVSTKAANLRLRSGWLGDA